MEKSFIIFKGYELEAEDLRQRLLSKVDTTDSNSCWNWTGSKNHKGYGRVSYRLNGKEVKLAAHRLSYALKHNTDPANLLVCHSCDNPGCINPDHLFLGTVKDNNRDAFNKKRNKTIGERNKKLTTEQVVEIKRLLKDSTISDYNLSKQFNINPGTIFNIKNGLTWKDVESS